MDGWINDRAMELDWGFFRRLYEGLFDHHDDVAGREGYLAASNGRWPPIWPTWRRCASES
ncbi:hypothetical protein [Actinomadura madurae]|uniref:hypothetical protein n=1 Tax=Actinomadura madurae TaxID=1993 RepID=UPI0020D248A9|nr:hypothetical protein [Actinomadura madurae]MCQ0007777.1 hypothetical protein [Actinomadura madurae]